MREAYAVALRDYVARGEEDALQHAFDLGRRAVREEPGVLDIAAVHHEALAGLLHELPAEDDGRVVKKAAEFLMEAISPFEMTHRSFQESNATLRELNEGLERRVEERTAELREKTEELEHSNAELRQFAYVASHDLQEPLRMISSYTQLLARRYKDRLDEDAREFIDYAVDGANRMQDLINDLLQYSRLGTRDIEFASIDSGKVLGLALADLRFAIEECGARVEHGTLPTVMGDERQLVQLFQNLIGNALKYRKKGQPPRVRVKARRGDGEWIFSVSDNGIGIEPQYAERIFVIFQRLHGRGEYAGTGIGLAICKRIVERHGGRIWMESEPGAGSKFWFTIPDEHTGLEEGHVE